MAIVGGLPEFDTAPIENLIREVFVSERWDRTARTARLVNATDSVMAVATAIESVAEAINHLATVIERGSDGNQEMA